MESRLAGALAHLATDRTSPADLTINVWDSRSTRTDRPPSLGPALEAVTDEGHFSGPIYYFSDETQQALERWHTLAAYDSSQRVGWFWAPAPERMLSWDWAYPFRPILDWWLRERGMLLVHGGGVGTTEGGALITGAGGAGKSTSALSTLGSDLRFAGDDLVAIEPGEAPMLHSLYSSAKLATHHADRFPQLLPSIVNPDRAAAEKAVSYVHSAFPHGTVAGFPLRAILLPRVTHGPAPRAVRAPAAEALAALAPSTIFQAHPLPERGLATMAALVKRIPSYRLELGGDIHAIPKVVGELLEELR
jgi:hypothetical protein